MVQVRNVVEFWRSLLLTSGSDIRWQRGVNCIYMCVHKIYVHISNTNTHTHTYTHTYTHNPYIIHTCMHTYILTYTYLHMYIHTWYIHTYYVIHTHTYIHTMIHTMIHTYVMEWKIMQHDVMCILLQISGLTNSPINVDKTLNDGNTWKNGW